MVTRRPYSSPSMNKALKRIQTVGRSVQISAAKPNIAKKTQLQEQVQESEDYEAFYPHGEPVCHLTICNITKDAVVDLTGWEISLSGSAEVHTIQDVQFSPVGGRSSLRVSPKWFPGPGGTIYLRNRENIVVDKVSYYQELVQKSGRLLYFGQTHEWTVW
ncbi:hypothetical protein FOXG_10496 [Fusarium oxysporum f. sp. lycopersici 4287]|uniref:LTD domain-containing protein n=2 Tax=Fusarium oxysporum TaxID=5507 RepID=A0A0J9VH07_FUSO4|nr:hypothetical protein FOXG_10496 [Fusarium oxysporum f. sp. lycopersici 4287]KNB10151.1 hypothetical protein FOXG_10496 [Fusarium oxysporum f. sp. lycopersici 4287]